MCSNISPPKALSYFKASFSVFPIILTIPGIFLVCLAIIKDLFKNLKTPLQLFPVKSSGHWSGCGKDYGSSVSCFSHQRSASTWHRRYQNLAHFVLYFAHGVYFNTHGTYRGQICGSIIASEVKNNVTSKCAILTSLSIWLAVLGFSFAYFQLGFIFYSFIFANTVVLSTFGLLIFGARNPKVSGSIPRNFFYVLARDKTKKHSQEPMGWLLLIHVVPIHLIAQNAIVFRDMYLQCSFNQRAA